MFPVRSIIAAAALLGSTVAYAAECVEDEDCGPGWYCLILEDSDEGTCVPSWVQMCDVELQDCPSDMICDPIHPDCDPETEDHCSVGVCMEWWFVEPCEEDDDCPQGWVCEEEMVCYCDGYTVYTSPGYEIDGCECIVDDEKWCFAAGPDDGSESPGDNEMDGTGSNGDASCGCDSAAGSRSSLNAVLMLLALLLLMKSRACPVDASRET